MLTEFVGFWWIYFALAIILMFIAVTPLTHKASTAMFLFLGGLACLILFGVSIFVLFIRAVV